MGTVILLHARPSTEASGRGTPAGQSQPSGQRSENQSITSSYLRAVKVVEPSTTRSKKRQSPAARRPKVVKLSERAAAYAEAQAMRFDRSSVSMIRLNSRKTPTMQAEKVGIFQLDAGPLKSDKSAMTPAQVRARIQKALDDAKPPLGPITVALDLGWERNYLRDFLEGKKDSLKAERYFQISEQFNIPINELITIKERPSRRRA